MMCAKGIDSYLPLVLTLEAEPFPIQSEMKYALAIRLFQDRSVSLLFMVITRLHLLLWVSIAAPGSTLLTQWYLPAML